MCKQPKLLSYDSTWVQKQNSSMLTGYCDVVHDKMLHVLIIRIYEDISISESFWIHIFKQSISNYGLSL